MQTLAQERRVGVRVAVERFVDQLDEEGLEVRLPGRGLLGHDDCHDAWDGSMPGNSSRVTGDRSGPAGISPLTARRVLGIPSRWGRWVPSRVARLPASPARLRVRAPSGSDSNLSDQPRAPRSPGRFLHNAPRVARPPRRLRAPCRRAEPARDPRHPGPRRASSSVTPTCTPTSPTSSDTSAFSSPPPRCVSPSPTCRHPSRSTR